MLPCCELFDLNFHLVIFGSWQVVGETKYGLTVCNKNKQICVTYVKLRFQKM